MSDEKSDRKSRSLKYRAVSKQTPRSEFDFINFLKGRASISHAAARTPNSSLITHHLSLVNGIGDDAAVIRGSSRTDLVITTDLLVEEIDFRLGWTPPRLLGHKALAVSLSDIAAMGAQPTFALVSIGLPKKIWKSSFVDEFYEGFLALAEAHQVTLIGGDISRTPDRVVIDSIVIGEVKRGRAVLRSGAKPGDQIYVTGSLGGAAAGLKLLKAGVRVNSRKSRASRAEAEQQLLLRQLKPVPRVLFGKLLGQKRLAKAMIDISDGLSSDLAHMCEESGVGARIDAAQIPVDPNVAHLGKNDLDPLALALNGGEDFELLFTVGAANREALSDNIEAIPLTHIGHITDEQTIKLVADGKEKELSPQGFTHF